MDAHDQAAHSSKVVTHAISTQGTGDAYKSAADGSEGAHGFAAEDSWAAHKAAAGGADATTAPLSLSEDRLKAILREHGLLPISDRREGSDREHVSIHMTRSVGGASSVS